MTEETFIAVSFPALYRGIRDLARVFLASIRATTGDPAQWPQAQFYDIIVREVGGTAIGVTNGNDYGQSLRAAWLQTSALPSYKAVTEELEKLKADGRIAGSWQPDLTATFALPIVSKYVISGRSIEPFDEAEFAKFYAEVEAYLSGTVNSVRALLSLTNLVADVSPVALGESHRIVKLNKETVKKILARAYGVDVPISTGSHFFVGAFSGRNAMYAHPEQPVLEVTFRYPKEKVPELSLILSNEANAAITALRLSLPGTGFVEILDYEHTGFVPELGRFGFGEQRSAMRFDYKLDEDVSTTLSRRWPDSIWAASRLFAAPSPLSTPLRIALERFNSSFERTVLTDRLLDFIIALEALCSKAGDAVSYKVPLRVAALVGRDATERDALFKLIDGAYNERSNLAHGRASKLKGDASVREYLLSLERPTPQDPPCVH